MQEPPSARGILQWGNWLLQPYFGTVPILPEIQGCPARGWRGLARLGEGWIYPNLGSGFGSAQGAGSDVAPSYGLGVCDCFGGCFWWKTGPGTSSPTSLGVSGMALS